MNYTKIQKIIASIIIPFFFFGLVFRFPISILNNSSAGDKNLYSLVSILVDNEIYNNIKSSVETYSEDIQKQLNNTKVIIIPTPKNASSFSIASLNESLYYEGYKGVNKSTNFESKLVGTILIGNFPVPVVYKNNKTTKTILPYVDFEDKSFIYDHKTKKYKENKDNINGVKPEIWHGIISPNTGDKNKNISKIKDYFEKNHNFYEGTGNFKGKNGIINGLTSEKNPSDYKPYVFYFDEFREQAGVSYSKFLGYKSYLENKEDIVYKRYSKELANKIKGEVLDSSKQKINNLIKEINPNFSIGQSSNGPDVSQSPDIMTKAIVDKTTKKFAEVINSSKIGELRKNVNNAGRYSVSGKKVNVDMIPHLISTLDEIGDSVLKGVNHTLEGEINDIVINRGLSRKIALPTTINQKNNYGITGNTYNCQNNYENILFGNLAKNITKASECSIYLGNNNFGQLVEANRGINLKNVSDDIKLCNRAKTKGYWGGNSPLNLDKTQASNGVIKLNNHNLNSSIKPIFDVAGSFKIDDNSKIPSPLDCLNNNYFVSNEQNNYFSHLGGNCQTTYQIPINGQSAIGWNCNTENKKYIFNKNFKDLYTSIHGTKCDDTKKIIYLDNNKIKESVQEPFSILKGNGCNIIEKNTKTYSYKTIPSYIKHISPTFEELNIQLNSKITPNLGIDKNRYIDFISAKGNYSKIEYPYLFRVNNNLGKFKTFDLQLNATKASLNNYLNKKSEEINKIISENNPSSLTGVDLEIYNNYLKISNYPNSNIDLLKFIKNQPSQKINISGEEKELSYYDSLVFALFWNNLSSIGQKYKFVFENYLSDQTNNKYKHFLAKNKKIYEIAYLGAPGDSQNMYVKLDPEEKGKNPFSDIDKKNALLNANLISSNLNNLGENNNEGAFKCAPPEGVPLWKWPKAVFCWIGEMLPAKIDINSSRCSSKTLFKNDVFGKEKDKKAEEKYACQSDINKNGVEDCIEDEIKDSKIELISSAKKSYINQYIGLKTKVISKEGKLITKLNNIKTNFKLLKIEAKKDSSKDFYPENTEIVYDSNSKNEISEKNKNKFILFQDGYSPVQRGIAQYSLNSKNKEANYYFQSEIELLDKDKKIIKKLKSKIIKVEIREDLLFSSKYRINKEGKIKNGADNIYASDKKNIYLIDLNKTSQNKISNEINKNSLSKEKLVIPLNHYSKNNKQIPLNYPLKVSITKDGKKFIEDFNIIESNLEKFKSLYSLDKAGEYKIKITNKFGENTTQTFNVLPEIASKIDLNLSTNILEKSGNPSSNIIVLKDKYGNIANGTNYNLILESKGNFGFPLNKGEILSKKEINVYEGYKAFRLKPGKNSGVGKIKITLKNNDKILTTEEKSIQIIDKINIDLIKPNNIVVGNKEYKFEAIFKDSAGNLLKNLNTKLYFGINKIYGTTKNYYVNVVNGKAEINFKTKKLAGKNIPIELKIEGTREIKTDKITINPEKPIKLDLILSKSKLRASADSKSTLRVELKDFYNNLVFNDSSTKIKFDIDDKYKKVINTEGNSIKTIQNGTSLFDLKATPTPGTAYFKISTIPSLEKNSFKIGEKVVNGIGEKSGKIQTFFFWNKDTFKEKKYNSLYTVMLGAPYGDITKKDYLASSILFDKNNRSLSVTSLIDNPYKFSDVIRFSKDSKIINTSKGSDLSQDIEFSPGIDNKNKLFINIFNKALNNQIGKIHYNFSENTTIGICKTTIPECGIKKDKNSINLKSIDSNYSVSKNGDNIYLEKNGNKVLTIKSDGTFYKNSIINFEIDKSSLEKYLVFNIKIENNNVAKLIINSSKSNFITSRTKNKTNTLLSTNNNLVIISLKSYNYGTHQTYSDEGNITSIFYNDPFKKSNSLNSFAKSSTFGLENFEKQGNIGWGGENKFLLNFASGQKVGESVRQNQSIGTINLGDPVISLKKNKNKFSDNTEKSFDSTIGKQLSTDDDISGYKVFDYDNDNKDDILLIKNNGYFKLLENKKHSQEFLDKGNLAYIVDYGDPKFVQAGDFTGDGYDDIFFINNKGVPYLLNNVNKDFTRFSLKKQFSSLKGKIVQAESFDMDADGKLDITTLDDSGEINIFYGGGTSSSPKFTKKFIGSGFGIKLSPKIRNSGAFIYFKGLYQVPEEPNTNKTVVNEELLNNQIFVKIPYGNTTSTGAEAIKEALPTGENVSADTTDSINNFLKNNSKNIKYTGTNYTQLKTFIKSEYSEASGIKIEKKFIDENGGNLKSGDIVNVEIKIKNISNKIKRNLVYIDNIEKPFSIVPNSIILEKGKQKKSAPGYDLLIDEINLVPNSSTTIKYKLKTPDLTFGNIRVGLFEEKGVFGEDKFGDIIVSKDNKNCSGNISIFNSDNYIPRKYSDLTNRAPICDDNKLKLPDEIDQNIEEKTTELLNDTTKAQKYAEEKNKELFSDGEEKETNDILKNLNSFNDEVDKKVKDLDNMIEGFACGFGGGSCIATPLNWAPLAPGNDPTLFGNPIGDGLKVGEGVPILSGLTGINVPTSGGCYQVPAIWPASPFKYTGTCNTSLGAGGVLGTNSSTNFVRMFVTPTLTGGVGTAVCFGGPASVVGNSIPEGVSPIVPGGNCIVYAKPLLGCSADGSEGDPESMGQSDSFGDFGIINGNCSTSGVQKENKSTINKNFVKKYYEKKYSGDKYNAQFEKEYKKVIKEFSSNIKGSTTGGQIGQTPLFSINGQGVGGDSLKSNINTSNSDKETFEDVIQIKKNRISPFPSFLMDWATRQIEEAVTKLADFPTLFVILPDFSGLIDTNWLEQGGKTDDVYKKGVEKEKHNDEATKNKIKALQEQKSKLNCEEEKIKCLTLDVKIGQLYAQLGVDFEKGQESGIKTAYEFLGNVPIVNIQPQQVNVDIPWLDENTIDKILIDWKTTSKQWEDEINKYNLIGNKANDGSNISVKGNVNLSKLLGTLKQNIATLEEYKKIPRKLTKLFNQKEIYINQVMCNVEGISEITSGWIGRNGIRFKAWVETYIAIKSILKSWQLLVDVFIDYDSECHECKNERNDLLNFQFKLIDMVIPKFPVIKFPKWPDLILDLHNIRAAINIKLPDINVTQRTVNIPNLPKLRLPNASFNGQLDIPSMPLLSMYHIPELPDLPTLPSVSLPDLPPPPQLPKIFTSLEGVLKILKLITKAMCLLKSLPFVPEWRAGDQIAFLTERNGYLPTDFVDFSLPEFSLPYVDAIKVSTFVNLEKDNSFLVKILKNVVEPLNSSTSDISNSFTKAGLDDLDFSNKSININKKTKVGGNTSFHNIMGKGIIKLFSYIENNKEQTVSSSDFISLANESLSNIEFNNNSNKNISQIKKVWETAGNYTYSKENSLIANLQKNNSEKFGLVNDILINEIKKNNKAKKNLKEYINSRKKLFKKVSGKPINKDFVTYNKKLEKYNEKFLISAKNLIVGKTDIEKKYIKKESKNLLSRVNGGIKKYEEQKNKNINNSLKKVKYNNLLAKTGDTSTNNPSQNSCQQANSSAYHYNYKGLYIIEKKKSYRLFNYMDELTGDEKYSPIDYDSDGDDDLLYFVNGKLYLKENLKEQKNLNITPAGTEILNISDNKYFNGEKFIEAINGFKETNTDNGVLNLNFKAPTDDSINNFQIEYYTIVDKFLNKNNSNDGIKKHIINAFIRNNTFENNNDNYKIKSHNSYISSIGEIPAVILNTPEMINIGKSLSKNNRINLSATTKIYTANNPAKIKYFIGENSDSPLEKNIPKNSSINFKENITITSIHGKVYSKGNKNISLIGRDIINYIGLPLFSNSSFNIIPDLKNKLDYTKAHIEIKYSGSNKEKSINFVKTDSYTNYDLGNKSDNYLVRINTPNDFFYGKIYAIKKGVFGTYSKQTLFSPQIEADDIAPELDLSNIDNKNLSRNGIRIPVYQKVKINFTKSIYENSGINGLKSIKVKLKENSNISPDNIVIDKKFNNINITFGEFNKLFKEEIILVLEDKNGNISNNKINFEIYSPTPEIENNDGNKITGKVSEKLFGEPVNIYKIRSGRISRLENKNNKIKVNSIDEGNFNFKYNNIKSNKLLLKNKILDIAEINENTGKIKIKDSNYKIQIEKTDYLFPKIKIINSINNEVYSQFIKLDKNIDINIVTNFNEIKDRGLYLNTNNNNFYKIPNGAKYSAGAVVIHKKDNTKNIYFKIFPDGRIDYNKNKFYIEYKSIGENILLELKSKIGNKKIAELLYNINASYLMK